jgi:predicted membrane protein
MRLMGFLFVCLTFLAGVTVGTVEIALINIVLFLGMALLAARYLEPRFGRSGVVYGMAGAFFASVMWPAAIMLARTDAGCQGEDCLPGEPYTVTIPKAPA